MTESMAGKMRWKWLLILVLTAGSIVTLVLARPELGLDLKGGAELLYKVDWSNIPPSERQQHITDTVEVLRMRLDPQGIREMLIENAGTDRIRIQIPELDRKAIENDKQLIESAGTLEFKIILTDTGTDDPANEQSARLIRRARREGKAPARHKIYFRPLPGTLSAEELEAKQKEIIQEGVYGTDWVLVKSADPYKVTGRHLGRVYPTTDERGLPAVGFTVRREARDLFGRFTGDNVGKSLATILDGHLRSTAVIKSRITDHGQITGRFTMDEVKNYIRILEAGSLRVNLVFDSEQFVGPSLGRESIRRGKVAIAIGFALVVLFIAVYYRAAGLVADLAVVLNLAYVLAFMALAAQRVALTLPGIAGLILTVGMSVDANVLIFERIREERAGGRSLREAIQAGYKRAFTTIFDANVTTLITALVLYIVGTGPLKGFATTLSLGIVASMFTALFVTRVIILSLVNAGWVHKLGMFQLVRDPHIAFMRKAPIFLTLSLVLVVLGIAGTSAGGRAVLDTDFLGGSYVRVQLDKPLAVSEARRRLSEAGLTSAQVQTLMSESVAVGASEGDQFGIRVSELESQGLEEKINKAFAGLATGDLIVQSDLVSPRLAQEMKDRAYWAIAISLVAIVAYIWLRFGKLRSGLAAVAALFHDVVICLGAVTAAAMLGGTDFDFLGAGDIRINLTVLGALLTIIGYSLNDTIVVFDRIREERADRELTGNVVDRSINATLSRTILTSLTTFMVVIVLYLVGGQRIHGFAFVMCTGVIVGTYSSVFIASPMLLLGKLFGRGPKEAGEQ